MPIHLETTIPAAPEQVYELLTDGDGFGKATGMPGYGGTSEGEFFSVHGGNTLGRQIELVPGERVVQAVRLKAWEPGVWSLLTFTLAPAPEGTLLTLDQVGYPPSLHDHLVAGYPMFYFTPMAEYFTGADYTSRIRIEVPPERVSDALTSVRDLASWWAPVTSTGPGELRFDFGAGAPLVIQVLEAAPGTAVRWRVESSPMLPEWAGTTITFTLQRTPAGGTVIEFRHHGLRRELSCYDFCVEGWQQYLPSLRDYLESGTGNPFQLGDKMRAAPERQTLLSRTGRGAHAVPAARRPHRAPRRQIPANALRANDVDAAAMHTWQRERGIHIVSARQGPGGRQRGVTHPG
jgi:uncharacterized protein YndB with AHSA1/START domain